MDDEARVWIRKRTNKAGKNVYDLRWVDPTEQRWKSRAVGSDSKRAQREAAKLEAELYNGTYKAIRKTTWAAFVEEHVGMIRGKGDAAEARRTLTEFGGMFGKSLRAITFNVIESYVERLTAPKDAGGKGNSQATVNKKLRYLRGAFNKAVKRGYIARSPMDGWQWTRLNEKTPRITTDAEETALLTAAKELYGLRWECFIRAALDTGGRRGELQGLTWESIDLDAPDVLFTMTKGKRDRRIPLDDNPELVDMLRRLHVQTQEQGGPFVGMGSGGLIDREWAAILGKADVTGLTIHDMRRTFCTRLVRAGVPLPAVQKLAGHSNIKTTLTYYNAVTDDDMVAGMKKLHQWRTAG